MSGPSAGSLLIGLGVALVVVGLAVSAGALQWFGQLPGDVRIEREGFRLYIPITSMVLASVFLTLLFTLLTRLGR